MTMAISWEIRLANTQKKKRKKEEKRRLGIVLIFILTDVLKFTKLRVCVCKPKLPLSKYKCRIGTTQPYSMKVEAPP